MKARSARTHTISVRLSEVEFASIQAYCTTQNARSISDLIRKMLCEQANNQYAFMPPITEFATHLKIVEKKVEQLTAEVEMLKKDKIIPAVQRTDEGIHSNKNG